MTGRTTTMGNGRTITLKFYYLVNNYPQNPQLPFSFSLNINLYFSEPDISSSNRKSKIKSNMQLNEYKKTFQNFIILKFCFYKQPLLTEYNSGCCFCKQVSSFKDFHYFALIYCTLGPFFKEQTIAISLFFSLKHVLEYIKFNQYYY